MRNVLKLFLGLMLAGAVAFAAKTDVRIGTGGEKGNYYGMMQDVFSEDYCIDGLGKNKKGENFTPQVLTSGGSISNLDGLLSKKFEIGIVQTDVLMSKAKKQPRKINSNRMKIIMGMHIEQVHLLIKEGYKPKRKVQNTSKPNQGGWANIWNKFTGNSNENNNVKKVQKEIKLDLMSLKGQEIASWGGSAVSARALSYFYGLDWDVKEIKAENRSNIDIPIFLVGGQPYKPVEEYLSTGNYKLVGLDYNKISAKAPFYLSSNISYTIDGVEHTASSIGIQALLIGKAFRKESRNAKMVSLAKCIDENLLDLADDSNTNPNWQSVSELAEEGNQINWQYFPLK
jgi:TRAP-type uncharacterized transport system substrate-binding protein